MIRLTPNLDQSPVDPESLDDIDAIIQARIDRRISRRSLIRRAAQIGIAAPVVGVMLHATSDLVLGAPAQSGGARITRFATATPAAVTGPTAPSGTPQQGGTLVCGTNEDIDTLHPWLSQQAISADVDSGMLEGLLEYDSSPKLQPVLAESYSISTDGLVYTFKLRSGVTWHNGDSFTAQDFIDSWKMVMNPSFGAFGQLGWDQITSIQAPDPLTAVVTTKTVYAPFISYIAGNGAVLAPSSEIAKGVDTFQHAYGQAPVGTGPFKFVEWKAKESVTLAANATYWGGAPKLDKLIIQIVPDDNTLVVQLQTGEVQMAAGAAALSALKVDDALKISDINLYEYATFSWSHLDLKQMDHLRVTKVRQALDFATPTAEIISQLLKGRATQSTADIAPGCWAYDPNIQPRPYDLNQAAQLLTDAGLTKNNGVWEGPTPGEGDDKPNQATPVTAATPVSTPIDPNTNLTGPVKPLEIELWGLSGDTQAQQIIQVIAASWTQLGVKVSPKFEDISTIWGPEGYQFTQAMTAAFFSWVNSVDPDDAYYWASDQIPSTPTGTGGNLPAYFHKYSFQAQIDQLTYAGAHEPDQDKRKAIYWQIQELLHEQVPVIFMYWANAYPAVTNKLAGFWPSVSNQLFWNVEQWAFVQ